MKTGEIAKMMGLNSKTITNWTDEKSLAEFFTEGAKKEDSSISQRDYSLEDVFVINTIRIHKTRQNTWKDVARILQTGHRETDLPASATLIKTMSPVDKLEQLMEIKNQRDIVIAQLEMAQFEIDRIKTENTELHDKMRSMYGEQQRIIGRLEQKIEQLEKELKSRGNKNDKPSHTDSDE